MPNTWKLHLPLLLLYVFLLIGTIAGAIFNIPALHLVCKPLLMPVLAYFFYINFSKPLNTFGKAIIAALFFSWGGDVLLMFQAKHELYFVFGLVSFLIAHLFYCYAFTKTKRPNKSGEIFKNPWLVLPFLCYGLGLMYILWPHLADMRIPVLVYGLIIMAMAIFAGNRYGKVNYSSFSAIFLGALIFISSDSLIALNKFYTPVLYSALWIMLTYCLAQYLIVRGALLQYSK